MILQTVPGGVIVIQDDADQQLLQLPVSDRGVVVGVGAGEAGRSPTVVTVIYVGASARQCVFPGAGRRARSRKPFFLAAEGG